MTDELTEPREVRKHLIQMFYGRASADGRPLSTTEMSMLSPLIRNVMHWGEAQGWSGEDTMTMLAYQALLQCERLTDRVIEEINLAPGPSFFQGHTPPR